MPTEAFRPIDPDELQNALDFARPLILGHAGDIQIVSIEDGVVTVAFIGACQACPNLPMTFIGPVRSSLMTVRGVREVRSADVHASPRALQRIAVALGAHPMPELSSRWPAS